MAESDGEDRARRIIEVGSGLDYAEEARAAIARSWTLTDPSCMDLALKDAAAWAALETARQIENLVKMLAGGDLL